MEIFDRNEAIKIADIANEIKRETQFNDLLSSIKSHARNGEYSMRFHKSRLTKYEREKLIERGFDVVSDDTHYLVSWTKKTEE